MPPPKTDEEIQAGWGPQQWEFLKWNNENTEAIQASMRQGAEWDAFDKLIEQKWPDPKDQEAFDEWCDEWFGRHDTRMSYQMSSREFLDMVSKTNFFDNEKAGALYWTMEMHNMPFVTLCESNFGGVLTCYCFKPLTKYLEPNRKDSGQGQEVIDSIVLTMELDPDVLDRRLANSLGDSLSHSRPPSFFFGYGPEPTSLASPTALPDSRMSSLSPFIFAQFGAIFVFGGDWEKARRSGRDAINEGPWLQNGR
ncbi:hypothetical protein FSARC_2740 [Fusarium sarcochroum]|uniref:Uncharacterized protein n=1 Tax=Fusarium sarcochroum TaxID=1208366 RepID=A0A8H4XCJ0_9HYPO|nr:hypothetical protein FSARC_2740 [Fusarium sarcochroum]